MGAVTTRYVFLGLGVVAAVAAAGGARSKAASAPRQRAISAAARTSRSAAGRRAARELAGRPPAVAPVRVLGPDGLVRWQRAASSSDDLGGQTQFACAREPPARSSSRRAGIDTNIRISQPLPGGASALRLRDRTGQARGRVPQWRPDGACRRPCRLLSGGHDEGLRAPDRSSRRTVPRRPRRRVRPAGSARCGNRTTLPRVEDSRRSPRLDAAACRTARSAVGRQSFLREHRRSRPARARGCASSAPGSGGGASSVVAPDGRRDRAHQLPDRAAVRARAACYRSVRRKRGREAAHGSSAVKRSRLVVRQERLSA